MAKKKEETIIEEKVEQSISPLISPLGVVFPSEDLNKLVEKINEIIARLNA